MPLPCIFPAERLMGHEENLERDGFSVVDSVLADRDVNRIREEIEAIRPSEGVHTRKGSIFGARNLLQVLPSVRSLVESSGVNRLIGGRARPVRGILFDKTSKANWNVAWHQDLTIAVREKRLVAGFGPWTIKAGVPHAQPPLSVLEKMITLRIHLDHTDEANGALRVIPGSHQLGRLNPISIEQLLTKETPAICSVNAGGGLLMRPLLLHSSLSCAIPSHRRVLHIEFSTDKLPGGLEWYGY